MKFKRFQYVTCYYCGKKTRLDKAVIIYASPKIIPETTEQNKPLAVITAPRKIYVCPSCARFRGISKRSIKTKSDLLKKLGIEV